MTTTSKSSNITGLGGVIFLLFFILLFIVLHFGREILVPLVGAAFFAMLMAPISRWLEIKLSRPFAVIICILILLAGILGIFAIVAGEVNSFSDDLPKIEKKSNEMIKSLEETIEIHFGVNQERQVAMAKEQLQGLGKSAGGYIGKVLGGVTGLFGALVICLVYTFLLLYHRERYETFFIKLFGKGDPEGAKEIIENVTSVGQHYIKGRTVSILMLWVIYAIGFAVSGLKSGILLAGIAALLSIIPYIGGLIGGIFPLFMAMTDDDPSGTATGVVITLIAAHALSTYIIEPLVVGGRMKLSALAMIVIIIAGNAVWGIVGMILFVPLLAMAKIVFEHVTALKPYAYLISDPDEGKASAIEDWFVAMWHKVFKTKKPHKPAVR
jgi:predicted PurR-regulated permease PerM